MSDQQNDRLPSVSPSSFTRSVTPPDGKIKVVEQVTNEGVFILSEDDQIRPGKIKNLIQTGISGDKDFWQALYFLQSFLKVREKERQAANNDLKFPQRQRGVENKRTPFIETQDTKKIENIVEIAVGFAEDYLRGLLPEPPVYAAKVIKNELDVLNEVRKGFRDAGSDLEAHPYCVTQLARLLMKSTKARIAEGIEPSSGLMEDTGIRPRLTAFEKMFINPESLRAK